MAPRSAASRSARQGRANRDEDEIGGLADLVSRHRAALAGATAFAVAFGYVSANAVWYQPHAHGGAFFETRPISRDLATAPYGDQAAVETIIRLERQNPSTTETARDSQPGEIHPSQHMRTETPAAASAPMPAAPGIPSPTGDPVIKEVQRVLAELKFYNGTVDGLTGPRTREAVEAYRKRMGLGGNADIDQQLLNQLGIGELVSAPPRPTSSPGTDLIETASAVPSAAKTSGDPVVMRIQAGLRAFGNDGVDVDGVVGARTRSAILEFQSLFGLPETGEPDAAVYAKMREIGLTD